MIYKFLMTIRRLPLYMRWSSATSPKLSSAERVDRLRKLEAPNGPKQIIMVQIANELLRAKKKDEAKAQYMLAKDDELSWGGRTNKTVSKYIALYCDYCSQLALFGIEKDPPPEMVAMFEGLKSLPVPESIKGYKLPLPFSPDGKVY